MNHFMLMTDETKFKFTYKNKYTSIETWKYLQDVQILWHMNGDTNSLDHYPTQSSLDDI